jgi:hypothetical protein
MFDLTVRTPPIGRMDDAGHKWFDLAGIELELENVSFLDPDRAVPQGWDTHSDQSLRNGVEFVTLRPVGGSDLGAAIENFYNHKLTYETGPRCSTHIHINMTNSTTEVLQSMFLIMYAIESALYVSVEESRKWGGYAMALNQMNNSRIRSILSPVSDLNLRNGIAPARNQERYYGFNTNIRRHGTVEFRYFPGGPTKEELCSWVDFVYLVKKAAMKYSVANLIDNINSSFDLEMFLLREFADWGPRLLKAVPADSMFAMFSEVSSMAADTDNREIPSALVFQNKAVMNFIGKNLLAGNSDALKYLQGVVAKAPVMAKSEWDYYYSSARQMSGNTATKRSVLLRRSDEVEAEDYDEDDDSWQGEEDDSHEDIFISSSEPMLRSAAEIVRSAQRITVPAPARTPLPTTWAEYNPSSDTNDIINRYMSALNADGSTGEQG